MFSTVNTHIPGHNSIFLFFISKILYSELLEDLVRNKVLKNDRSLMVGRPCMVRIFKTCSLESMGGLSGFCGLLICKCGWIHEQLHIFLNKPAVFFIFLERSYLPG